MATPEVEIEDILTYYSIQYKATQDNAYLMPVEGQRQTGDRMYLKPGVYQLRLSFTGTESAYLWWRPKGYAGGTFRVCEISEDSQGSPRNSDVATVQAEEGAFFAVVPTPRANTQENPTSTASVTVFPQPS